MKPRITIVRTSGAKKDTPSVQIYMNPAGRDLLVKQLSALSDDQEHLHLWPEKWGDSDIPLRTTPYNSREEIVVEDVKILLRLDSWDQQYFPHVMKDGEDD